MAYDIFTNIQGPAVPVSLYGDAASQGINAGNALPTQLTAGIQGAIKGIQQGQEIVANQQQQEIRENIIQQLPTQNRRQEAALEADLTANRINAVKANIVEANATAAQEEQLAELEYKEQAFNTAAQNATALADYTKEIGGLDPASFKNNFMGGKYDSIYNTNPKAYERAIDNVILNQGKNGLTQAELNALQTVRRKSNAINSIDKLKYEHAQKQEASKKAVFGDTLTNSLVPKLGGDPRTYPQKVAVAPQNKYLLDPETHRLLRDPDHPGQFVENTPANRAYWNQKSAIPYDGKDPAFLAHDPKTGEILVDNVSKESKELYAEDVKLDDLGSGKTAQQTADQITSKYREQLTKENAAQTATEGPGYEAVAQKTLGVTPETIAAVEPSLVALDKQASIYVTSPQARNTPAGVNARAATVRNTAKAIAQHNFNANPDLKNTYNEKSVFAWNKGLEGNIEALDLAAPEMSEEMYNNLLDTFKAQKVSDPFGLYYERQGAAIEKNVDDLFTQLTQAKSLIAGRAVNTMATSKVNLERLASIRSAQKQGD